MIGTLWNMSDPTFDLPITKTQVCTQQANVHLIIVNFSRDAREVRERWAQAFCGRPVACIFWALTSVDELLALFHGFAIAGPETVQRGHHLGVALSKRGLVICEWPEIGDHL